MIRKPSIKSKLSVSQLIELRKEFHDLTIKYLEDSDCQYRKSKGQYFTPKSIREKLLKQLPNYKKSVKVLDPACGSGEFLLSASKYFKTPFLYGWDIEENLIRVANKMVPGANFNVVDSLNHRTQEKFDFVIGNPPYFEYKPEKTIKERYQEVVNGRPNIFAFFIKLGLDLLKPGGYLAYIVPPSMNNGAYFASLRNYIVRHSNIEHISILENPKLFHQALQTTMILILRKGKNTGDYIFKKNGLLIFAEKLNYLKKLFKGKTTLRDLGYSVKTGRIVWNQNKDLLTNNPDEGIPLIWARNITSEGLCLSRDLKKPQYIKIHNYDIGPAIVVNRIIGSVNNGNLKAAFIPKGMRFVGENHVNVIFPPDKNRQLDTLSFDNGKVSMNNLFRQLKSKEGLKVIRYITGNTQISKTELENLFPVSAN